MQAIHSTQLAPSGVSHALSCCLTPPQTVPPVVVSPSASTSNSSSPAQATVVSHLVTARDSSLSVFQLVEYTDDGGSAVSAKLVHLISRRLHGAVTALHRVRTLASRVDGADRVLISFQHAKMSLMEWSAAAHDLVPVSLHTFEKLPQLASSEVPVQTAVDPASRVAVMLLPTNTGGDASLAILPFFQEEIDFDALGLDVAAEGDAAHDTSAEGEPDWRKSDMASLPYAPSHLLPLSALTAPSAAAAFNMTASRSSTLANAHTASTSGPPPVRNVIDLVFLPGFNDPTLAILYSPQQTWAGRLDLVKDNCLVSLVTLNPNTSASSAAALSGARHNSDDEDSLASLASIIGTSPPLPFSSLSLTPCPPDVGGVLVTTADGIIHLEQSGKMTGVAANSLFPAELSSPATSNGDSSAAMKQDDDDDDAVCERLEGARVTFVAPSRALIFCRSGTVLDLALQRAGRTVSALVLRPVRDPVSRARCISASAPSAVVARVRRVGVWGKHGYVLVGSDAADATLVRFVVGARSEVVPTRSRLTPGKPALDGELAAIEYKEEGDDDLPQQLGQQQKVKAESTPAPPFKPAAEEAPNDMDVDFDEDDLYGDAVAEPSTSAAAAAAQASVATTTSTDVKMNDDVDVDDIYADADVVEEEDGATAPMRIELCDTVQAHGSIRAMTMGAALAKPDSTSSPPELVCATGAGTGAGLTILHRSIPAREVLLLRAEGIEEGTHRRVATRISAVGDWLLASDDAASWLLPSSAAQLVDSGSLDVSELAHDPVLGASQLEEAGWLIVTRTRLLRLLGSKLSVCAKLPSPAVLAEFASAFVLVTLEKGSALYTTQGDSVQRLNLSTTVPQGAHASVFTNSSVPLLGGNASESRTWLVVAEAAAEGSLKIFLLPSLDLAWQCTGISMFPTVLEDGYEQAVPADVDAEEVAVRSVTCFTSGGELPRTHIMVTTASDTSALYEAVPTYERTVERSQGSLGMRLSKIVSKRLVTTGHKLCAPSVVRFDLRREGGARFSGLFITGARPLWVVATEHGPARFFEHAESPVSAFCPSGGDGAYVAQLGDVLCYAKLPRDICLDRELPVTRIRQNRVYNGLTFDVDSGTYVASVTFDVRFSSFDEENKPLFDKHGPNVLEPQSNRSSLELLSPETLQPIDGYEFRAFEFVSTLRTVNLTTKSTATGRKDFIAVGTCVYRGEDLSTRGGLYLFEVVEVNAASGSPASRLRLRYFDDSKSVVSSITDIDGYLMASCGQKIYMRALEQDQYLVPVAFLDVGVHVTTMETLKNFVLIGDVRKGVSFVAFQEDPYRLVFLGRETKSSSVANANFLVHDNKLSIVSGDTSGVIRMHEYDPTNVASQGGHMLMCRTEYATGSEALSTMLFTRRTGADEATRQSGILYAGTDGSLFSVVPLRDAVYRRLQALQTQLLRYVQHFAGLNPRGRRIVRNDSVSRALTRGMLDGDLLSAFESEPFDRQSKLTDLIGTDPDTVGLNLRNIATPWSA